MLYSCTHVATVGIKGLILVHVLDENLQSRRELSSHFFITKIEFMDEGGLSQALTVEKILDQLESAHSPAEQVPVLKELSELAFDTSVAQEFVSRDGLKLIISRIENEAWFVSFVIDIVVWHIVSKSVSN